jgi:hypothetical protein
VGNESVDERLLFRVKNKPVVEVVGEIHCYDSARWCEQVALQCAVLSVRANLP